MGTLPWKTTGLWMRWTPEHPWPDSHSSNRLQRTDNKRCSKGPRIRRGTVRIRTQSRSRVCRKASRKPIQRRGGWACGRHETTALRPVPVNVAQRNQLGALWKGEEEITQAGSSGCRAGQKSSADTVLFFLSKRCKMVKYSSLQHLNELFRLNRVRRRRWRHKKKEIKEYLTNFGRTACK